MALLISYASVVAEQMNPLQLMCTIGYCRYNISFCLSAGLRSRLMQNNCVNGWRVFDHGLKHCFGQSR